MGDRRQGDRRESEKGVLKIKFKNAVIYALIAIVLILSLSINVFLSILNRKYRTIIDQYESEEFYDEDYRYEDEETDEYSDEYIDETLDNETEDNTI